MTPQPSGPRPTGRTTKTRGDCDDERCGAPQSGAGRPRKGWIRVQQTGQDTAVWVCSWRCLSFYAIGAELRAMTESITETAGD